MDSESKTKKLTGGRLVPMRRHPRARAFEAWCRRQGIRPCEPTPAVVSPSVGLHRLRPSQCSLILKLRSVRR